MLNALYGIIVDLQENAKMLESEVQTTSEQCSYDLETKEHKCKYDLGAHRVKIKSALSLCETGFLYTSYLFLSFFWSLQIFGEH